MKIVFFLIFVSYVALCNAQVQPSSAYKILKTEKSFRTSIAPLYFVDGKEINQDQVSKIKNDDIEQINVLKDTSATNQYGERAKSGVILIKMRKTIKIEE